MIATTGHRSGRLTRQERNMKRMELCVVSLAGLLAAQAFAQPGLHPKVAPGALPWSPGGTTDAIPFSENFDTYGAGSIFPCSTGSPGCAGPNGFALFGVYSTTSALTTAPQGG